LFRRTNMQPAYEKYKSGCQMISLLTNLEVQLFDHERVSQIHYASYDLPNVIERYKQEALVQILQQPLVKEHVYVFRNAIPLAFLTACIWYGADFSGNILVSLRMSNYY